MCASLLFFINCTHDYEMEDCDCDQSRLSFVVVDEGFTNDNADTRTSESDYKTNFTEGDRIGIFIVDAEGKVVTSNICLTYDGSAWNHSNESERLVYKSEETPQMSFFAYYPYQETLSGAPKIGDQPKCDNATNFFSTVTEEWRPATDQRFYEQYTASDLMIAKGTLKKMDDKNDIYQITFKMAHQMALMKFHLPYWSLSTNSNYRFVFGFAGDGFYPYHISYGIYRYIVKPKTENSFSGSYSVTADHFNAKKTFTSSITINSGKYYTLQVDGGDTHITSYTLKIGDYLLDDGSIVPSEATNAYLLSCLKRAIGIVFSVSPSDEDKNSGWKSGYAVALADVPDTGEWSANNIPTPTGTSRWYLPSTGQWRDILINLGGLSAATESAPSFSWQDDNCAEVAAIALNGYLSKAKDHGASISSFAVGTGYKCGTENGAETSCFTYFLDSGEVLISDENKYTEKKVRPVIAF